MLVTKLLRRKIGEVEHDLLQKNAYVVVRWAQNKFNGVDVVTHAVERMRIKFPKIGKDDIEEAVHAMYFNMGIEAGGLSK